MSRVAFTVCALTLGAIVLAQSVAHVVVVLYRDRLGTMFDLDRSNGLPDVVSTVVLALGATGAIVLALNERRGGFRREASAAVAGLLAVLALADLVHDGAHPSREGGGIVTGFALVAVALLAFLGRFAPLRARLTLAAGASCLAASFLVLGLDRLDHWFERRRGDPVAELQIVTKEGLELLGWGLVAIALWDLAVRRRAERAGRASPGARPVAERPAAAPVSAEQPGPPRLD